MPNPFAQFDKPKENPFAKFHAEKPPEPDKPLSASEDVKETIEDMPMKFVGGTVMALPNIINQAAAGPQELYRGLTGREHDNSPLWKPFYGSEDVFPTHQPTTPAGMAVDTFGNVLSQVAGGKTGKAMKENPEFIQNIREDIKPEPIMSADEIKGVSQLKYKQAEQLGGALKPDVSNRWLTSLNDLIPNGKISKALAENRPFKKLINELQIAKDQPITLEDAQGIDEMLGASADAHFKPGGMDKEGQKILEIQDKFRDSIFNAKETDMMGGATGFKAWDDAKFYWSQSMKQRDIEKIVERANLTDNPVTAMKTGFKNLFTNDKRMRGFSEEERVAVKNAAKTGIPSEMLRIVGSRLIPIARVAHGDLTSAATGQAAAMAARAAGTKMQIARANKVSREISKRVQNRMKSSDFDKTLQQVGQ